MYLSFCIIYDFHIAQLVKYIIYTKMCLSMMIKNNCMMQEIIFYIKWYHIIRIKIQ